MRTRLALLFTSVLFLAGCDDLAKWAYNTGISAERARAGLVAHHVQTGDIDWMYLESEDTDDKPVVLLIHGFGADSSNWVRFANELQGDYHFIIPDLPGHGETTRNTTLDYGVMLQGQRLLQLADKLGIQRFHIAGSSMGGAISIATALEAPDRVLSLGLVDAAGVTLVTPEFGALLAKGSDPLIPHKPDDMFVTMDWAMADPPWMPDFFVEQMGALKAANAAVAEKVQHDINGKMEMRDQLKDIQAPTLIVWGQKDRLLSVDNVAVFDQQIPDSRAVILNGLGHLPMAENPAKVADAFRTFWQEAITHDQDRSAAN